MTNFVVDTLSAYRKHVGTNQPEGQLLAPEALKLLPLFVNALMRHVSLAAEHVGPGRGARVLPVLAPCGVIALPPGVCSPPAHLCAAFLATVARLYVVAGHFDR